MIIPGLIFLATPHNVSKAYLAAMTALDLVPEKTIYIEFTSKYAEKERSYLKKMVNSAISYAGITRQRLAHKEFRPFIDDVSEIFRRQSCKPKLTDEETVLYNNVVSYARKRALPIGDFFSSTRSILDSLKISYECIKVPSLNDPEFIKCLETAPQSHALYVDGGILRQPVLNTHIKFIHIHPGLVPEVRGSMCLFWGALVYNRIGVSSFFMNEGIDTGDIISTKNYEIPEIVVPDYLLRLEYAKIRYNALENYLDPCYRADVLHSLLAAEHDPHKWKSIPQKTNKGRVYYYQHPIIRNKAVSRFFRSAT